MLFFFFLKEEEFCDLMILLLGALLDLEKEKMTLMSTLLYEIS